LTNIYTVTLGDRTNPLPVTLISFDAKRSGADAVLTWSTATETNSKGFEVQVSTTGSEFRTLGFVASQSANSTQATAYRYTDTEKNKTGVRYYRLRQLDIDDHETLYAPRTVAFDGAAEVASLSAYPNPFTGSDLRLALASTSIGDARLSLTDMTGRTLSQQTVNLVAGTNEMVFNNLNDLKAGVYMVRLALPTGTTQNLRVVKQ
jgi:hypothetical protein